VRWCKCWRISAPPRRAASTWLREGVQRRRVLRAQRGTARTARRRARRQRAIRARCRACACCGKLGCALRGCGADGAARRSSVPAPARATRPRRTPPAGARDDDAPVAPIAGRACAAARAAARWQRCRAGVHISDASKCAHADADRDCARVVSY
jgi:hypothetical protein